MDSEIKQRWISKLTSGQYAQTKSKLADDTGYCCLGVLCEIAVEDGIVFKKTPENKLDRHWYVSKTNPEDTEGSILPDAVRRWAGLPDENPDVTFFNENGVEESATLAELNDNGSTFREIADLIEGSL